MPPGPPPGRPGLSGSKNRKIQGSFGGARVPKWMDLTDDLGPLTVLQLKPIDDGTPLPRDPFLIKRVIEEHIGGKIESGFPEHGGASYGLHVRKPSQITKLKQLNQISGTPCVVIEHPERNFCKCTAFSKDLDHYDDNQLVNLLEEQGVTGVYRFTKLVDGDRKPTGLMTFTIKGCTIPEFLFFGFIRVRTKMFYPSPMLCYNCWDFGHTSKRCQQANPVCGKCSGDHFCPKETPCEKDPYCKRCQSTSHQLSSRNCPFYQVEQEIQKIRTDEGVSYQHARQIYEAENPDTSYASITQTNSQTEEMRLLSAKLDKLSQDLANRDATIAQLTEDNRRLTEAMLKMQETISEQQRTMLGFQQGLDSGRSTSTTTEPMKPTTTTNKSVLIPKKGTLSKSEILKLQKQQRQIAQETQRKIKISDANNETILTPATPEEDQDHLTFGQQPKDQRPPKSNRPDSPVEPEEVKRVKTSEQDSSLDSFLKDLSSSDLGGDDMDL